MAEKDEEKKVPKWISELKPKRKWLKLLGGVFGFIPVCKSYDEEFGYCMSRKRWWFEPKKCREARVMFPLKRADFARYAFDSAERLLFAFLSTPTLLVSGRDTNPVAQLVSNGFTGVKCLEELELKLVLLGKKSVPRKSKISALGVGSL